MADRMKLKVTGVSEVIKVGDKQIPKLNFKALNDKGQELPYFSFKESIFEQIKPDTTLDVEVLTEQKGDYTNRKVLQIFVDGHPVGGFKKQGGFFRPDNTASIESQTAAKITSDLIIAGKLPANGDHYNALLKWLSSRLGGEYKPEPVKPVTKPLPNTPDKPQDEQETHGTVRRNLSTIKTITDMQKAVHADFGLQPKEIMAELNIKVWSELTLTPADAYRQIASTRQ